MLPPGRLRVLDVGCGNGALAGALSTLGHDVSGVDESESGIQQARLAWPQVYFSVRSCYADLGGPYDLVIATEVIEHLYAPSTALRRIRAALTPEGHAILSTPYHGYLKNLALSVAGKWDSHHTVHWEGGHVKFFSKRTLRTMLVSVGFDERIEFRGAGRFPLFWKSMVCRARRNGQNCV